MASWAHSGGSSSARAAGRLAPGHGNLIMSLPARSDGNPVLTARFEEALRARVAGELDVPVLSTTATRVLANSRDENGDLDELTELIASDQSLAAHVLRVANSAGQAPLVPILSLHQAIGRLGLATVGDVAIAIALKERVFSVPGREA